MELLGLIYSVNRGWVNELQPLSGEQFNCEATFGIRSGYTLIVMALFKALIRCNDLCYGVIMCASSG